MGEGTIYPLMRRMQTDGLVKTYLVESANGPPRKYYKLTAAGRAAFVAQKAEWEVFASSVGKIVGDSKVNREQFLAELRAALRGLDPQEIDDIVADYRAHFAEAQAAGRSEQDVARHSATRSGSPRSFAPRPDCDAGRTAARRAITSAPSSPCAAWRPSICSSCCRSCACSAWSRSSSASCFSPWSSRASAAGEPVLAGTIRQLEPCSQHRPGRSRPDRGRHRLGRPAAAGDGGRAAAPEQIRTSPLSTAQAGR